MKKSELTIMTEVISSKFRIAFNEKLLEQGIDRYEAASRIGRTKQWIDSALKSSSFNVKTMIELADSVGAEIKFDLV